MRKRFDLFVKVPWHYTGIDQEHNLCFEVHDERVAKLLIDGFGLSTIDVEIANDSVITYEEKAANESIYTGVNPCATYVVKEEKKPFSGNCQFCNSKPAVGRVEDDFAELYYCCSYCELEALEQGYSAVSEYEE